MRALQSTRTASSLHGSNAGTRWLRGALLFGAVLAMAGCSTDFLGRARQYTYPPSFNYITDEQLQGTMWQLAAHVNTLDELLDDERTPSPAERLQIITVLEQMESVSQELGPRDWPSNHPGISRNVGSFRDDVARARRSVQLEPPGYEFARSVPDACMHCHAKQ